MINIYIMTTLYKFIQKRSGRSSAISPYKSFSKKDDQ